MTAPRVTVLMPVHNGGQFLGEAVRSVLAQTFTDFELLVMDDGSTDDSAAQVESFHDPRIRLVRNGRNLGLIATLNRGLDLAAGEYLARMDCDDISLPRRLERQAAFLDAHPEVGVCGAWFRKFGAGAPKVVRWETEPAAVRAAMLFSSSLAHPTVMLRRDRFADLGLRYDPGFPHAEDYDLWCRAMGHMEPANLPEVLLDYRVHPGQVTQRLSAAQVETAGRIRLRLLREAGIEPTEEEFLLHQAVSICDPLGIDDIFPRVDEWLCRLKRHNDRTRYVAEPGFSIVLLERWLTFGKKCFRRGGSSRRYLFRKPAIMGETGLGWGDAARLLYQRLRG